MDTLPTQELLPQSEVTPGEPIPSLKYNFQYKKHPYMNIAFDAHVYFSDKRRLVTPAEMFEREYVCRKKVYITNKNIFKYNEHGKDNPHYKYFIEMKQDFDQVLEPYFDQHFPGCETDFWTSMMLIEYACPFATEENAIEMRTFNTNVWGPEHCDETLAGLHIGEDVQEFQACANGEYRYIPELMDNHAFFFYGEHSEEYGHTPTFHRMIPHKTEPNSTRYSIIIDVK